MAAPRDRTYSFSHIAILDAGAVEQVRIELGLSHVAPVFLDQLLNPVLSPHMRWLVSVCLKPFPPAGEEIEV